MRCSALGCPKGPGKNGTFCVGHWRRLPRDLRAPNRIKEAVVHLGKLDGYLVEVPRRRAVITDVKGTEYV